EMWRSSDRRHTTPYTPVPTIRELLRLCPDAAPSPGTTELAFVNQADLRESIRLDISLANVDLADGNWKGATVLSRSAIEALLLWALQEYQAQHAGSVTTAIATLRTNGTLTRDPDRNLERWDLHEFGEAAAHLGIVKADTAELVRLTKDYRN